MTPSETDLDAYGRYVTARKFARAVGVVGSTAEDLRLAEPEVSPTALVKDQVYSTGDMGESLDAGVSYGTGPWSMSATYFHGEWEDDPGGATLHSAVTWATRAANVWRPDDAPISSPFQTIYERRSEAEKVSELIGLIRRSDELPFAKRLARRLKELVHIAQEEAPDQSEMSSVSLRTLFRLLKYHPDLSKPSVVLTPSGNILAEWRAAPNKLCAAEFLGGGRVHFVVFTPDTRDPRETIRLSGVALPVEDFVSAVEPHGAGVWMRR